MIFKNIYTHDKSHAFIINLDDISAINHDGRSSDNHKYTIYFKSGAVGKFVGVGLMNTWSEYLDKKKDVKVGMEIKS